MVDVTVRLDKAYDDLRSIDSDLAALGGRNFQDRLSRKRAAVDSPAAAGPFRNGERRVQDVGGRRRIIISTENDNYNDRDRSDNKRLRYDEGGEHSFQAPVRRTLPSSVVMPTIETKSREATLTEMKKNSSKEDTTRNRRLFGNLLVGTLRQFQKEEKVVGAPTKVQVDKQREVERRLEEAKTEDKNKVLKEKEELMKKRLEKEREIQRLKRRKAITQYSEEKIKHYKTLQLYIQTQAKPALFYLPAKHTLRTLELLKKSSEKIDGLIATRQEQTEKELRKDDEDHTDNDLPAGGLRSSVVSVVRPKPDSRRNGKEESSESDYDSNEEDEPPKLKSSVAVRVTEESSSAKENGNSDKKEESPNKEAEQEGNRDTSGGEEEEEK
jgi:pinin